MENIERKLSSRNRALIAQIFSEIVEKAKTKETPTQEFVFLKEKCLSDDMLVNIAAQSALLDLIENKVLRVDDVLADFISRISTTSNIVSLTKAIIQLLNLQLKEKFKALGIEKDYKLCKLYQHPLVKILQREPQHNVQLSIYYGIVPICLSYPIGFYRQYESLFLYCLCSPNSKVDLGFLKQKLWIFLMTFSLEHHGDYLIKLCSWLQIQGGNVEQSAYLLNDALQIQLTSSKILKYIDLVILLQILAIAHLILNSENCQVAIETTLLVLSKIDFCHHNIALLILSKAVLVCPSTYLESLLKLCYYFANSNMCKPYSFFSLKAALLMWLSSPKSLCQKALKIAQSILSLNDHMYSKRGPLTRSSRLSIERFHYLFFCNPDLLLTVQLGDQIENSTNTDIAEFLENLEQIPLGFLNNLFTFLCGLLLGNSITSDSKVKVLNLILRCSQRDPELLTSILSVVLHLLSNSDDCNLHFELLKAMPKTVRLKENVPKVLAAIQVISRASSALNDLSLRLLYDSWEIDNTCYAALENIFASSSLKTTVLEVSEHNISKASIFKKLAQNRPELYGKDLVAHLSTILNECTTSEGAVATSLALEGIRYLCKAEVIDVVTTWTTLSPKFKDDTRGPVIASLCGLISEISNLEYAQPYDNLNNEVTGQLWNYAIFSEDETIANVAFEALSDFNLELICLHIPKVYLEQEKHSYVGENRLIAGKAWIKFLRSYKFAAVAQEFLTKLVFKEINNYLKYIYQLKTRREPETYGALPSHSVVRALGEFLKNNFHKLGNWENEPNEQLFKSCLKILSLKYSKPLPPFDWCFLQELFHVPTLRDYCLDLASHQAILSGSARRLMENFIVAMTGEIQVHGSLNIYKNLNSLANSIQPAILQLFLQNTLMSWSQSSAECLEAAIVCLKKVLDDKEVQDVNKNVIEAVLTEVMFVSNVESQVFNLILSCLASFSINGQEKISRFTSEVVTLKEFIKTMKIRCSLAKTSTTNHPLTWLNDVFVVAIKNTFGLNQYCDILVETLKLRLNHVDSPHWLNELFGDIQAKVADRCTLAEIENLCDILALAVVSFSGIIAIISKHYNQSIKYFFPMALKSLMEESLWSYQLTQVLEWLHHMNQSETIPKNYRLIFGWALASLRHKEEFFKGSQWMKYLDCQIHEHNVL
ncbi:focadhesin [Euwallacea fornicatus]|uniref:focadhesin n=1 Tax=Euwallacea fornicatus TaxID=995702 RepID=UPI00338E7449